MKLGAFIKLIRPDNLLVIIITLFATRYCLIEPLLTEYPGVSLELSLTDFCVLTFCMVLIAAAGYIINDYFDVKTDKINKPERLYIDHGVKRRVAMLAHTQFNLLGVLLGAYVAYRAGNIYLAAIPFGYTTLLWFYSTHFKRQLLVGNVTVSLLSAFVPMLALLFEKQVMLNYTTVTWVYAGVICFSVFAFLLSMAREIIKDMEDVEGDTETGCRTMPVAWGIKASKAMAVVFLSNIMLLLGFVLLKLIQKELFAMAAYLFVAVLIPVILLTFKLYKAHQKADFHRLSIWIKLIMVAGILSTAFIYYYEHVYRQSI